MPALQQQEDNEEVFQEHQEMFLSMGVVRGTITPLISGAVAFI